MLLPVPPPASAGELCPKDRGGLLFPPFPPSSAAVRRRRYLDPSQAFRIDRQICSNSSTKEMEEEATSLKRREKERGKKWGEMEKGGEETDKKGRGGGKGGEEISCVSDRKSDGGRG